VHELAERLKPRTDGGLLAHKGQVEVVSSHDAEGEVASNLRWGTYVVFEAADEYVRRCFADYGLKTDASGRYGALWRPYHLIGLELGISVASVALRGEPTGAPTGFRADVVCVAKRRLEAGEVLDGEGGYRVWGRLMPAADSLAMGALPIGLAHGRLSRAVEAGQVVRRADVAPDGTTEAHRLRAEMERVLAPGAARAAE
jgi:predicted homoserine dehydrogenase-like protein